MSNDTPTKRDYPIKCLCCEKLVPPGETWTQHNYHNFTFENQNEGLCNSCSSHDLAVAHREVVRKDAEAYERGYQAAVRDEKKFRSEYKRQWRIKQKI